MNIEYNSVEFCQEMRRRLSLHDLLLTEKQSKVVYNVVFDVLQHALVEHGTFLIPNLCRMSLKRGKPRQFGVMSFGRETGEKENKTVLSCSIWIHAKMNRNFNKLLRQAKTTPSSDPRMAAAVARIEEVDDYVPEQFDGPDEELKLSGADVGRLE